ncbi:hypothetical protein L2E82_11328 [Cichorium intybus]|uniref:Uncharacterized protein n=1 Tax=Cichorium intybus TaxID=13427 RepID=A0ACB9GDQ7_CICIN|nr:hypothetical protein L2E82_11328 [Cichorium intybus]
MATDNNDAPPKGIRVGNKKDLLVFHQLTEGLQIPYGLLEKLEQTCIVQRGKVFQGLMHIVRIVDTGAGLLQLLPQLPSTLPGTFSHLSQSQGHQGLVPQHLENLLSSLTPSFLLLNLVTPPAFVPPSPDQDILLYNGNPALERSLFNYQQFIIFFKSSNMGLREMAWGG